MYKSNFSRSVNLLSNINADTISTNINDQVAAFNSYGQMYGITSNSGTFLKDNGNGDYVFSSPTIEDINFDLTPNFALVSSNTGSIQDSTISTTKLTYLYNVSSDIQTQLDGKQSLLSLTNRLSTAFISPGTVSSTEFGYLDGVTSSIQTQLNSKQSTLSGTNFLDAAFIGTGVISNTEFNYLDGVTSSIQTQINTKQSTLSGTNFLDAAFIGTGVISNTEFNYLNGVTSSIQTQIDNKQDILWQIIDDNTLRTISRRNIDTVKISNTDSILYMGNTSYYRDSAINIGDPTYGTYGLKILRSSALQSRIVHKGTADFMMLCEEAANFKVKIVSTDILTINSTNTTLSNNLILSTPLNVSYIGTGVISNTEFNYLDGVTSSIQTQINNKQDIFFTAASGLLNTTANIQINNSANTSGDCTLRLNNSNVSNTTGNIYIDMYDPTYSYGLRILRSNAGITTITHKGTQDFRIITENAASLKLSTNNTTRLLIDSSGNATFTNNLTVTGTTTLTTKLDASNIGTGVVDNTEFNYLNGVTSSIQTQINNKQPTYFTLSGTDILPAATTYNYNLVRNDSSENYFKIGNTNSSILNNTYLDIVDYTNGAYGMRLSKLSFAYGSSLGTFENKGGQLQIRSDDDISIIHNSINKIKITASNVDIPNTTTSSSGTTMRVQFNNLTTLQTGHQFIAFQNSGGTIGSIRGTGSSSTIAYATTSDRRIKENIVTTNSSDHYNLIKNNSNQTCQYNYINDEDDNKQIGFIAQDIREIFPQCVQGNDTDLEEYGQPLTVDYSRVTPLLYSALKQSITEIEQIKLELQKHHKLLESIQQRL